MEFLAASGRPAAAACGESRLSRDLLHSSPSSKVGDAVSTKSLIPSHQALFFLNKCCCVWPGSFGVRMCSVSPPAGT